MNYFYDKKTKEFLYSESIKIDPLVLKRTGKEVPVRYPNCTQIAPPTIKPGEVAVFEDKKWAVKIDKRGTRFYKDGAWFKIQNIGEDVPEGGMIEGSEELRIEAAKQKLKALRSRKEFTPISHQDKQFQIRPGDIIRFNDVIAEAIENNLDDTASMQWRALDNSWVNLTLVDFKEINQKRRNQTKIAFQVFGEFESRPDLHLIDLEQKFEARCKEVSDVL